MDFQEICSCGVVTKFANRFPFLLKSNSNSKHFKYSQQKQLHVP